MSTASEADRIAAVAAIIEREGIICEGVSVAGADRDVAVLRTPAIDADRLAAVSTRIKALGFRFVTIDLEALKGES